MTLTARLYDLLHTGNPGDVAFYRRLCDDAETVLELGCGAGRVALPLAADGCRVVGIDLDAAMLAIAHDRRERCPAHVAARLELLHGDMREVSLGARFDRVIIPYNSLYCLPTDDEILRCLRAARRHLNPDGLLLFDGYAAWPLTDDPTPTLNPPAGEPPAWIAQLHDGDVRVEVYERDRHEPATRRFVITYEHHLHHPDGRVEVHLAEMHQHYLDPHALPDLLSDAGLMLVGLWGDFDQSGFDEDAERLVVAAAVADELEGDEE